MPTEQFYTVSVAVTQESSKPMHHHKARLLILFTQHKIDSEIPYQVKYMRNFNESQKNLNEIIYALESEFTL